MWMILLGIFTILHGLVHLLYAGQSWRLFELRSGMLWPDGSWLFSKLLTQRTTRLLAAFALALTALGFIFAGLGLIFRQDWWRSVVVGSTLFSSAIFLVFWDGKLHSLDDKGGVGLLINLAILILVQVLKWPI
jgi:hypothetical protein